MGTNAQIFAEQITHLCFLKGGNNGIQSPVFSELRWTKRMVTQLNENFLHVSVLIRHNIWCFKDFIQQNRHWSCTLLP